MGETLTFTGSAIDAEDPSLPDAAFAWTVLRRHGGHTHPWASGTGRTFSFPAPAPEDLAAATTSSLSVDLVVTDSAGPRRAPPPRCSPARRPSRWTPRPPACRCW